MRRPQRSKILFGKYKGWKIYPSINQEIEEVRHHRKRKKRVRLRTVLRRKDSKGVWRKQGYMITREYNVSDNHIENLIEAIRYAYMELMWKIHMSQLTRDIERLEKQSRPSGKELVPIDRGHENESELQRLGYPEIEGEKASKDTYEKFYEFVNT